MATKKDSLVADASEADSIGKKAAVFDYEGTVGEKGTAWIDIEKAFGVNLESAYNRFKKHLSGEWTWEEYQNRRIKPWNQNINGEDPSRVFNNAIRDHFDRHGVVDEANWLIDFLHEQNFETYLVSHAPDSYSQIGQRESGIQNHVDTVEVKIDREVKDILKRDNYCKEEFVEGLQDEGYEVWFFGNGENDFEAAEAADKGYILTNLDAEYDQIDDSVYTGNLEDICSHVGRHFRGEK